MVRPADSNFNYSPVRKAAKTVATAAVATGAAAGTVLLLAKKGKLDAVADGNKAVEGVKKFLKKYADPANEFIGAKATKLKTSANEFISNHEKLAGLKERAGEMIESVKEFDLVKHVAMAKETAGEFFKGLPAKAGNFFKEIPAKVTGFFKSIPETVGKIFHRTAK